MSVRITARCSYCTRKFTPEPDTDTAKRLIDDIAGHITCPECYCDYCGHGHTPSSLADCTAEQDERDAEADAERRLEFAH